MHTVGVLLHSSTNDATPLIDQYCKSHVRSMETLGFVCKVEMDSVQQLRSHPAVKAVERDTQVKANREIFRADRDAIRSKLEDTAHPHRHEASEFLKAYHCHSPHKGDNVDVYLIDSNPLAAAHIFETDELNQISDPYYIHPVHTYDPDPHGAFMALQILSVAPNVQLHPIVAHETVMDFVWGMYVVYKANPSKGVINYSMSSYVAATRSLLEEVMVDLLLANGITVVVSGSNEVRDSCLDSPNTVPNVLVVSRLFGPQPYGNCVSFASNQFISEAGGQDGSSSAATAWVSGVVALLLSGSSETLRPPQVKDLLLKSSQLTPYSTVPLLLCPNSGIPVGTLNSTTTNLGVVGMMVVCFYRMAVVSLVLSTPLVLFLYKNKSIPLVYSHCCMLTLLTVLSFSLGAGIITL